MVATLKHRILRRFNALLGTTGFKLIRKSEDPAIQDFLPLDTVLSRAKRAHLSVGDYLDHEYAIPGATQIGIDGMEKLGAFGPNVKRVCEIGPGSGRYLEKIIKRCSPSHYEIYETDREWSDWLAHSYPVVVRACDGRSLDSTPSETIDLVHAHKVFVYMPFVTSRQYFAEMARVVAPGGCVAFDILTENCLDEIPMEGWVRWAVIPRQYTIDFFAKLGLTFLGSFLASFSAGRTEYLAFTRPPAA